MTTPREPSRAEQLHAAIAKSLADNGSVLATGFDVMRQYLIPAGASAAQVDSMRLAFMIGAQHVFSTMAASLDGGSEPTDADMRRMELLSKELRAFEREMTLRGATVGGSA